ncbi:MAG: hypothetical protein WC341_14535 [Bacteroidales bacterium]|jgi:hypothetical protein
MNKKTLFYEIIFFGSIWGILEASLGYVLHFLPTLIAGTTMFAVASFILYRAFLKTNSKTALLWIGLVAAFIKAFDFFLPAHPIYGYVKVINPMFCILIETLMLFAILPVLAKKNLLSGGIALMGASLSWRSLFLVYLIFQDAVFKTVSTQLSSWESGLSFVVLNGLVSGLIALVFYGLNLLIGNRFLAKLPLKPVPAVLTFTLAVAVTLLL